MEEATKTTEKDKKTSVPKKKGKLDKSGVFMLSFGTISILGGAGLGAAAFLLPGETLSALEFPVIPSKDASAPVLSDLTGLPLNSTEEKTAPAYCIQTPNGTDGARPQAGLNQAGVVFEAIAEAGITRFAAIYQNPTSAVIGPIRSLRLYYLQWDTPFDCAIVHAGGADDAIEAVRGGDYKDLTENYYYMYRGSYGGRRWNNLFTSAANLAMVNNEWGLGGSNINGFTRMVPSEVEKDRVVKNGFSFSTTEPASGDTSAVPASATNIAINFGSWATFNVRYAYNPFTNSYLRSYETGDPHEVYVCPEEDLGDVNPEDRCHLEQLAPSVVAVMFVDERRAEDNYHEDITAVGSGEAYVFQNGYAAHGTWRKDSVSSQIRFYDESGAEIALVPGQTFVEAVPTYGNIDF